MKKIIDWVKSSNHYYHIGLLAALSLIMMSIGAFEFGASGLWTNVWQTAKFGILTGLVIEVYQAIVSKSVDLKNSGGDLLADLIGLVLGIGLYLLLAVGSPASAIVLFVFSITSCIFAFALPKHKYTLLLAFFGCAMIGFSLFIYA